MKAVSSIFTRLISLNSPGAHGIEDAWNAGVAESGVTIHWVDSGVDTGKVIKQVRVPRLESDTLDTFETRIHETEYKLYPEVLGTFGSSTKIREAIDWKEHFRL